MLVSSCLNWDGNRNTHSKLASNKPRELSISKSGMVGAVRDGENHKLIEQ